MKYLGIDYGIKNIGIATSDDSGVMAFPKEILYNDKFVLDKISQIVKEENIGEIVIGESLNYKGEPNKIMEKINLFKETLEKELVLPVWLEPEFLTSLEAEKTQGKTLNRRSGKKEEKLDASAAALILKSFLDKKNG
jgi:putative Holliday junction resolvase